MQSPTNGQGSRNLSTLKHTPSGDPVCIALFFYLLREMRDEKKIESCFAHPTVRMRLLLLDIQRKYPTQPERFKAIHNNIAIIDMNASPSYALYMYPKLSTDETNKIINENNLNCTAETLTKTLAAKVIDLLNVHEDKCLEIPLPAHTPNQNAPKIIHFIWLGGMLPPKFLKEILKLTAALKPDGFEINLWVDDTKNFSNSVANLELGALDLTDKTNFGINVRHIDEINDVIDKNDAPWKKIKPELKVALNEIAKLEMIGSKNLAAASDVIRYILMLVLGGYYIDVDNKYTFNKDYKYSFNESDVKKFKEDILPYGFKLNSNLKSNLLGNDLLIANPGNSFFIFVILELLERYEALYKRNIQDLEIQNIPVEKNDLPLLLEYSKNRVKNYLLSILSLLKEKYEPLKDAKLFIPNDDKTYPAIDDVILIENKNLVIIRKLSFSKSKNPNEIIIDLSSEDNDKLFDKFKNNIIFEEVKLSEDEIKNLKSNFIECIEKIKSLMTVTEGYIFRKDLKSPYNSDLKRSQTVNLTDLNSTLCFLLSRKLGGLAKDNPRHTKTLFASGPVLLGNIIAQLNNSLYSPQNITIDHSIFNGTIMLAGDASGNSWLSTNGRKLSYDDSQLFKKSRPKEEKIKAGTTKRPSKLYKP